jgi:hypothetical protein
MYEIQKQARAERAKRREKQKDALFNKCVSITMGENEEEKREVKHCDVQGIVSDKFKLRKNQKVGVGKMKSDSAYITNKGIQYFEDKALIRDLFVQDIQPLPMTNDYGTKKVRRSYIYIISKKVDDRTFIKIGFSTLDQRSTSSSRFKSFHTSLIPGLRNIGFRVHYLFFYIGEIYGSDQTTYAQNIEQDLHGVLRNDKHYKNHVIHYPSNKESEWYLPGDGDYESFLSFVLNYLSVQVPAPEEAYKFYEVNGIDHRESKDVFFKKVDRDEIIKYRKDYHEYRKEIRIKEKESEMKKERTKGKREYFIEKLITNASMSYPPLGKDIQIHDVIRYNKISTPIMKHGEFYVQMKTHLSLSEIQKIVFVHGDFELEGTTMKGFYTHIFDFLVAMNEINTLEKYDLTSNYNYYNTAPIERAKATLLAEERTEDKVAKIPKQDILWMKGRQLKDKSDEIYTVVDFVSSETDARKAVNVLCQRDSDPDDEKVQANIFTVARLIIEYHENDVPSMMLTDDFKREEIPIIENTAYNEYTLIKFNPNFFTNEETNEKINETYTGLITKKYVYFFDKEYTMFYDVLFESQEWRLKASAVDDNSRVVRGNDAKIIFLESVKGNLSIKAKYILDKLGLKEKRQNRRTRTSNRSKTRKTRKNISPTRKSMRIRQRQ